jgi:hypothetical protein
MGLGPSAGFSAFHGSEMHIFHYAGGGVFLYGIVDRNGGERRSLVCRTLNWTRSRHDRTRPVSSSSCLVRADWGLPSACPVTRGTGASGQVPEELRCTRGRSDTVARPVVCECLLESTGRWHCGVWSIQATRPVTWSTTRIMATRRRGVSDQF